MAFRDHIIGVPQSRWTGYAILAAIIAVALSVLFGKEHISLSRRVMIIILMFLLALPTILLVLFQINCLVSGTSKGPYCGWYAWLVAAFAIFYCLLLIIVAVSAKAYEEKVEKEKFTVSFEDANRIAGGLMAKVGMEGFEDVAKASVKVTEETKETKETKEKKAPTGDVTVATVEKTSAKSEEKKPAETFKVKKFTDGPNPKKPVKEGFSDYSFGAAPVGETANMYML